MGISEALDSDVAPEFRAQLPGGNLPIGRHSNLLTTDVDYSRDRRTIGLSAAATGSFRYSYEIEEVKPGPASGNLGFRLRVPGAGALSITQGLSYAPSYLYELLPGEPLPEGDVPLPPSNPEYRIDANESLSHRTQLGLTTGSGLGWSLSTTAGYTRSDFSDSSRFDGDRERWDAGTRVSFRPTRRRGFSFGYQYRGGRLGGPDTAIGHELPLGFEFSPAITQTRRFTLRVEVTPTMMEATGVAGADSEVAPEGGAEPARVRRRRYPVQGDVSITYPFHFRWHLSTGYRRGVEFQALLSEPVVTDGARFRLSGVMGRRLDLSIQGRYAAAASVVADGGEQRLRTANADARLRFALTRSLAIFGEYLYYYYDFGDQRRLAPGLPAIHEQHSVRLGVMLFAQPLGR
jgi:hypothetical protein